MQVTDEAFAASGAPRPEYRELLAWLDRVDVAALGERLKRRLRERGVTFGASADGLFALDPVPRLITPAEWEQLTAGIAQRLRALELFARDIYSHRAVVNAGVLPAHVLAAAPHVEPGPEQTKRWISIAGLDLVRGPDGRFRVLEDQIRMPSGLAYAVAAREALPELLDCEVPPLDVWDKLGAALREAARDDVDDPTVVILSEGPGDAAWYEHERIGREIGAPVVTLSDLEQRRGQLVARLPGGPLAVDVVYQRTEEDRFTDDEGRPTALGEALLEPCRSGRLVCVNAPGSALCDDKVVHAYVPEMIRFYMGEEPLLESVRSYDLADAEEREKALGRLDELVVKPRGEMGGKGVVIWSDADYDLRQRTLEAVKRSPEDYVAQERITLSTHPTLCDGRLEPRHVDLRPYVLVTDDGPWVVPGGLTRVALEKGSLIVNSGRGGGAKDTWIL